LAQTGDIFRPLVPDALQYPEDTIASTAEPGEALLEPSLICTIGGILAGLEFTSYPASSSTAKGSAKLHLLGTAKSTCDLSRIGDGLRPLEARE